MPQQRTKKYVMWKANESQRAREALHVTLHAPRLKPLAAPSFPAVHVAVQQPFPPPRNAVTFHSIGSSSRGNGKRVA